MAGELVQQDSDTIYGAAGLEMCLDVFGGCRVVHVAHEDASRIDVLLVLS